jgi:hypothetical protein
VGETFDARQLAGLGWTEMIERPWSELLKAGLPMQLESLARELGRSRNRPVQVFTMPMLEAGVIGLALPFAAGDGIVLDPSVVSAGRKKLGQVVAHELAYMLHPRWDDSGFTEYEEVESFASKLAPMLLAKPPDYQWTDVAILASPGRATSESATA